MWGVMFLDARLLLVVLNQLPEALPAHALAVHIDEQRRLIQRFHQLGPDIVNILGQRPDGGGIQGDDALLPLAVAL